MSDNGYIVYASQQYVNDAIANLDLGGDSSKVIYDNSTSGLTATNVNDAINELAAKDTNVLNDAKAYTDGKIAQEVTDRNTAISDAITNLVGLAPEERNTIEELAKAIEDHEDVTDALNSAITNKANASDLTDHANNADIHVTAEEKAKWNSTPEFTELILKSSTEGSDKKFKITIDDDGNLKVEEIIPPEVVLIDFTYTKNEDGTYTITDWKGTLNGEASTECIIPDHDLIKVNW